MSSKQNSQKDKLSHVNKNDLRVSVVIVNWNTSTLLRDCINSVYKETEPGIFEIIVVDNGSSDNSCHMVRELFPEVRLIANKENRGFAAANNQGMAIAKGHYVLLLNSDTVVLDKAIDKAVAFADSHQQAAIVGCRVLNPDRSLQLTCFMFPSILNMLLSTTYLYKLFPRNRFFGREHMTWWGKNEITEVDVVRGCFMLVRQKAIDHVGMMDEQFFMYGEETDWCYRFKKAGWKVMFTPVGEIIHLGGASSRQTSFEMTLQLRGSILLFLKKHKSRLTYTLVCLLVSLFFLLRIPYWFGAALFAKSDRIPCLRTARAYVMGAIKALTGSQSLCIRK